MVNITKLELTNLQQEILRLLFIMSGSSLNQRRISKLLGVSQPAVTKSLPKLEKEKFIKVQQDKESRRWSIELNRDNHRVIQLKRVDNLRRIYESGLSDFLFENFPGCTIIIFGSYSKGEDTTHSDIDIAIIDSKEKKIDLNKFNNIIGKSIVLNFYSSFKDIHKNLKENIFNGIILSGGINL